MTPSYLWRWTGNAVVAKHAIFWHYSLTFCLSILTHSNLHYYLHLNLQELKLKDDDVFLISFPKTGTTWMHQIIYSLLHYDDVRTCT